MAGGVAIIGAGWVPARAASPEQSYRELTYEAAVRAYKDAGVSHDEIQGFVTCAEDLLEGTSIFDEYTPDQMGAVQKPVHTVTGDGLYGLAVAWMKIRGGVMDLVAVQAHSKASNCLDLPKVLHYALDPVFARPLVPHPYAIAALEFSACTAAGVATPEAATAVVVKNKRNALDNPIAAHGSAVREDEVAAGASPFRPLRALDIAPHADGSVVLVLAGEERAKKSRKPVWVRGVGWSSESPTIETRTWTEADYCRKSAALAWKTAGIADPARGVDFAEVDDAFSFKELQHLEALGLGGGRACERARAGAFGPGGELPVNVSGGALGMGNLLEATGLYRVVEAVLQIRGEAGKRQLAKARSAVVQSWRGVPATSGAVAVLAA